MNLCFMNPCLMNPCFMNLYLAYDFVFLPPHKFVDKTYEKTPFNIFQGTSEHTTNLHKHVLC